MEVIKKGSVESIVVVLNDRLNNISDLGTLADLRFFTTKKSDTATVVQPESIVAVDPDEPMWAICSIDTALAAYDPNEEYNLYIKYVAGSEAPILGPERFRVVSD